MEAKTGTEMDYCDNRTLEMLWKGVLMWIKRVLEITKKTFRMIQKTLLTTKKLVWVRSSRQWTWRWYLFIYYYYYYNIIMSEINYNVRKFGNRRWPRWECSVGVSSGAELAIAKFFVCEKDARCVGDTWVSCWRSGWVPCAMLILQFCVKNYCWVLCDFGWHGVDAVLTH